MLTPDQIPERVRETLRRTRQVFPEAVIVGGYLRDLWARKEPKDIDIFIGPVLGVAAPADTLLNIADHLVPGVFGAARLMFDESYMSGANYADPVNLIVGVPVLGEPDTQFISMGRAMTVQDHLERVDLDFNQIVFDGETIHRTIGFELAMRTRVVSLGRKDDGIEQEDRTARRIERLKQKYRPEDGWVFPQLGYVVPEVVSVPPSAAQLGSFRL